MTEVAEAAGPESPDAEPTEGTAATTTPTDSEATWKRRLAGKDQALTATQQERDRIKSERDTLQTRLSEYEQANLTEVEKLQRERDEARQERDEAKASAAAVRLSAKYPLAAEALGDDLTRLDEARVAEINGRLAGETQEAESDAGDTPVNPNSPRRTPTQRDREPTDDELVGRLKSLGNPFRG